MRHGRVQHEKGLGGPIDYFEARTFAIRSCDLGSPIGCRNLGSLMATGEGTERDVARATKLLESAYDAGDGRACLLLGTLLEEEARDGKGSRVRAAYAYGRGCEGDNTIEPDCHSCSSFSPEACFRLGRLLRTRSSIPGDLSEKIMIRACQGGFLKACTEIQRSAPDETP